MADLDRRLTGNVTRTGDELTRQVGELRRRVDNLDATPDVNQSKWEYREMGGRVWRYRDICSLPFPEREKLKREKPAVWAAYWDETLKRPEYVTPEGKRWTKEMLDKLSEMDRLEVYDRDGDLLEWRLHGESV